jgi:hypothetical protein
VTVFVTEKLALQLKTATLNMAAQGLGFLGYRVYPNNISLAARSRKRYRVKMKEYTGLLESGSWSQAKFQQHATALNSFVFHADSLYFRKKVLTDLGQ